MATPPDTGGGFFVQDSSGTNVINSSFGLLSPAASSATAASSVTSGSTLPTPRRRPLKAGSTKESSFINYLDAKVRGVQRRFGLRVVGSTTPTSGKNNNQDNEDDDDEDDYNAEEEPQPDPVVSSDHAGIPNVQGQTANGNANVNTPQSIQGYTSFMQVATDISRLISIIWVSGTPSLQVHYLLSLALLVTTYIPEFPAAPKSMFSVLRKLDYAFASLAQGRDLDTGDVLPGFWGSGGEDEDDNTRSIPGISETAKVRIRSLVERTRVVVVDVMNNSDFFEAEGARLDRGAGDDQNETTDDEAGSALGFDGDADMSDDWDMEIARVYDRTLVELGSAIGGNTDDAMVLTD